MKTDTQLAALFAAFAHPKRIAILRTLLGHALTGRQFGDLVEDLDISPSTLKHHLDEMHSVGVLRREVRGRATMLSLDLGALTEAAAQLTRLCCAAEASLSPTSEVSSQ